MPDWQSRTSIILGEEGLRRLSLARIVVVGLGGVGAAAAEMIVRAGVGSVVLIDNDVFGESNLNRQLPALRSTLGRPKAEVLRERLLDVNPELRVECVQEYLCEENVSRLIGSPDLVIDAIDTLSPKVALIQYCLGAGVRLVSSMGSGAKLSATSVRIADISKTRMCPLAHMLRKRLHKLGIESGFLCVYSEERPIESAVILEESRNKKSQVGSISYLPTVFGCCCAEAAIRELAQIP